MQSYPIERKVELLRHTLGIGDHVKHKDWGFRNYFAACGFQVGEFEALVRQGLATKTGERDGLVYFAATEAGMRVAGLSAKKIKKLVIEK